MEPTRECSLGSTASVRLTPSAPGGHCSASAVPISKTRMAHAAVVLRMIPFKPLGGGRCAARVVLLRVRRERPSGYTAADQYDEVPPPHGAYPKAKDHELIIAPCIAARSGHFCPLWVAGSTGHCNTARSLSAGVSKPKVFRGR